jgi:hypothetical protein
MKLEIRRTAAFPASRPSWITHMEIDAGGGALRDGCCIAALGQQASWLVLLPLCFHDHISIAE